MPMQVSIAPVARDSLTEKHSHTSSQHVARGWRRTNCGGLGTGAAEGGCGVCARGSWGTHLARGGGGRARDGFGLGNHAEEAV
jgi:hypothetical protein